VRAQDTTTSGNSPWQEFGVFFGPIQKHTGVFHNENGVFIPWTTLCTSGQTYLLESCGSLIDSGGSLTSAGDTAVGCITNGAIATVFASQFNIPLDTIKGLLGGLAGLTGCGGIVNMDQIQTSPDLQRLVQFAVGMTSKTEVKFLPYENPTYGIKIQYPSNWIKEESQNQGSNDIVKFSSPAGTAPASLNIIGGRQMSQNISLEQYSSASINALRQSFPGFNLIESNSTTLGGLPAHKIVFKSLTPSGGELELMQVWTIKNAKDFIITYGALSKDFSNYIPTIQRMIDSYITVAQR